MPKTQLRYIKALDYFLSRIERTLPLIHIDPQDDRYNDAFLRAGMRIITVEPKKPDFPPNPLIRERVRYSVEDAALPYNSAGGIWAHHSMISLSREKCQRWMELFFDWLSPKGLLSFCLLEGEGFRVITEQGIAQTVKKKELYYHPEEIHAMLTFAGFTIIDAWRDGNPERMWIHVLAKK